jgi:hypothetical protein
LDVSRCDFLKVTSTSSVGVARCIVMPQLPLGDIQINVPEEIRSIKTSCHFRDTAHSVPLGVIGNQIAPIKGAPEFPVIRGLLCGKDYNLLMIITASAVLALLHNFQMGLLASKLPRGYGSIV